MLHRARRKRGQPIPTAHRTRTTILVELDRDTVLRALATRHSQYLMVGLLGVVCTPRMRSERYGRLREETADRDRSSCAHVSRALHRMCVLNAYREHRKRRVEGRRPSRRRTDPRHARRGEAPRYGASHPRTPSLCSRLDAGRCRCAKAGYAGLRVDATGNRESTRVHPKRQRQRRSRNEGRANAQTAR